jgi:hypothetical protein
VQITDRSIKNSPMALSMREAGGLLAIIGGILTIISAITTWLVGGVASAFKASGAEAIVLIG